MQIFILHLLPKKNASSYCDKHVVKIILEIAQLCSVAHQLARNPEYEPPYRITHRNHPWAKWVREKDHNYNFAVSTGLHLCREYTRRYHKTHKCQQHFDNFSIYKPASFPSTGPMDPFPQCFSKVYHDENPVQGYRNYVINSKILGNESKPMMFRYTNRVPPSWITANPLVSVTKLKENVYNIAKKVPVPDTNETSESSKKRTKKRKKRKRSDSRKSRQKRRKVIE
eukprot:TRINITY_DN1493_c0_g1_i1.p1 TRINITY_DN1493_c0_g1~~TRINITY_DN1493_c0_g1_i1.p1  ORF type:complete len:226 (+),score=34.83 TRINITY_DN1493_c0_g1_i1:62-739(+)